MTAIELMVRGDVIANNRGLQSWQDIRAGWNTLYYQEEQAGADPVCTAVLAGPFPRFYPTGDALAAALAVAMNAPTSCTLARAAGFNVYTVTYNAAAGSFTFGRTGTRNFAILWGQAPNNIRGALGLPATGNTGLAVTTTRATATPCCIGATPWPTRGRDWVGHGRRPAGRPVEVLRADRPRRPGAAPLAGGDLLQPARRPDVQRRDDQGAGGRDDLRHGLPDAAAADAASPALPAAGRRLRRSGRRHAGDLRLERLAVRGEQLSCNGFSAKVHSSRATCSPRRRPPRSRPSTRTSTTSSCSIPTGRRRTTWRARTAPGPPRPSR